MKKFLCKPFLGLVFLSSSYLASCSCEQVALSTQTEDTEKTVVTQNAPTGGGSVTSRSNENKEENEGNNTQGEDVEKETEEEIIDDSVYDVKNDPAIFLFADLNQKKKLIPVFDGEEVDPSQCNFSLDRNYYIIDENGIVSTNPDTDNVIGQIKERLTYWQEKYNSGEISSSTLSPEELIHIQYDYSSSAIVTVSLKNNPSKKVYYRLDGSFINLGSNSLIFGASVFDGDKNVVVHRINYGEDSTVTFSHEDTINNTYQLIFIDNHYAQLEDLLYTATFSQESVDDRPYITAHRSVEHSGTYKTIDYSMGDMIIINDAACAQVINLTMENTLVNNGEFDFFTLLGDSFNITINIT